ncbi:MAG: NosD domain-containing protein [Archaeoglobaceae archaeon]
MNRIKNVMLTLSALLAVLLVATAVTAGGPPANTPAAEKASSTVVVENDESIQAAIDDASDGDRILVQEGTYEELLTIDGKDIKLVAVGDVTIKNPSPSATIADRQDTIMISNSNCTIEGFTIDVNDGWGGIYAFGGPYYGTGEVDVTIKDNKVMDYERNGITANGELATGHIMQNNMVIGQKDTFWANNGIQIGWGATGIIKDNTVKTNYWIGEEWTASGIMVFDAKNVRVTGNTVEDCETGIYVLGINNKVVNNNLENELEEETWGIVIGNATPYIPWGLTYNESSNNKVIHNTINGYDYDVVDLGEDSKVHANVVR